MGIKEKLSRVKINDLLQLWKLPMAGIAYPFFRLRHKDLWIISEDPNEARDNGYWLFKYICEKTNQECVYVIHSSSSDYQKVNKLGKTIEYGSLKHWIYYLGSTKKISSQKAGNPNAALFYVLEIYGILKNKRIFLQHGITKDDADWLYYDNTKMHRFICGAYPEYEFIKERFHYPEGNVVYTGFSRFDNLFNNEIKRQILIMPTWREWISYENYRMKEIEGTTNFTETRYYKKWMEFLNNPQLEKLSKQYNIEFVFYPHRNMQKYIDNFNTDYVSILDAKNYDVQMLLKESALLITDYSSVYFDFAYMKKPIIFYQFDYGTYRENQYAEGYFNYKDNGFGESYENVNDILSELEKYLQNNFQVSERFIHEHQTYFKAYDNHNCERIYKMIKEA